MLTVSVIGSCRVFTPINRMKRRGRAAVGHENAEWYTHSTRDVLQKFEIMNGRPVPAEILPLLVHGVEKFHGDAAKPDFYQGTDVFVVEVASIKIYSGEGWYLQQWCVRDVLSDETQSASVRDIAGNATLMVMDKAQIKDDLALIVETLPAPVVFVPHVNVVTAMGRKIPERALINSAIEEFCADGTAKMFDPTPFVEDAGYDTAMIDSGHYRSHFEDEIGARLVDFLEANFTTAAA